jgi:hypothetical protein
MVINIWGIIIPFVASESILSVLFEMKTKGNRGNNGNIEAYYLYSKRFPPHVRLI